MSRLLALSTLFLLPGLHTAVAQNPATPQRPAARPPLIDAKLSALFERWCWEKYWESDSVLGPREVAGREVDGLLFWPPNPADPGVGLCSANLKTCVFYPDPLRRVMRKEANILPHETSAVAFDRFVSTSFTQYTAEPPGLSLREPGRIQRVTRSRPVFAHEELKFKLPALRPPISVREKRRVPQDVLEALHANLGCLSESNTACQLHLLIPFFRPEDPYIPVLRECRGCANGLPVIIFMERVGDLWWHGATNYVRDPDQVSFLRQRIAAALQAEVTGDQLTLSPQ